MRSPECFNRLKSTVRSNPEGEYKAFCHFDFLKTYQNGVLKEAMPTLPQRGSVLQFFEVKMTMSCILASLAGSKWYFDYSCICGNTCTGLIYASFDPSGDIKIYPNDPSDEFFFGYI